MHIAIVVRRLSGRGGMETAIRALAAAGRASRSPVTLSVWMMGRAEQTEWLSGIDHRFANIDQGTGRRLQLKAKLPLYAWTLRRWMRQSPVDAILATDPVFVKAALLARTRGTPAPRIFSWLHFPLRALANVSYLAGADGHLAISTDIAADIAALAPAARPTVVYNPLPAVPSLAAAPPDRPVVLFAGRLQNRQKRVDVLLAGLARVRDLDWRLTIAGDGPDRDALRELAEQLDLNARIDWLGWQADPWAAALPVTVTALTSDYEGFPMVLLESLARGIPVIATDCPTGPKDIVVPGENGWLVPPGEPEALAAALRATLTRPQPFTQTPAAMRTAAINRFAGPTVLARILEALAPAGAPARP